MHAIAKSLLAALIIGVFCTTCTRQDDGDRIRSMIAQGADAAEAHDIGAILDLATADVRAMPMDLDRQGIKAVLWRSFNYYGPLKVLYPRPTVDLDDSTNTASTVFPFLILKKEQPFPDLEALRGDPAAWLDAIGETADLYRLRLQLTKRDGDWLVEHAMLERFSGTTFVQ